MPAPGKNADGQQAKRCGDVIDIDSTAIDRANQKQDAQLYEQRHGNQGDDRAENCGDVQIEAPQSRAPFRRLFRQ